MIQYCDNTIYDHNVVNSEIENLKRRAGDQKIVISDELLAGSPLYGLHNRSTVAQRLQRYFPNARIVLCLRNQVGILDSYFQQITEMGLNEKFIDKRYVHKPGGGLSFSGWLERPDDWDTSRRFVDHMSMMSSEYFKYTKIYDLYNRLFDNISVLLFEDLREKDHRFFEVWASVAELSPEVIRRKSRKKMNTSESKGDMSSQILSNRLESLLENVDIPAKKYLRKILSNILTPFFHQESQKKYLRSIVKDAGIPEDNRRLSERGIVDLERYSSEYLLDLV